VTWSPLTRVGKSPAVRLEAGAAGEIEDEVGSYYSARQEDRFASLTLSSLTSVYLTGSRIGACAGS
jgi:hypothetical protein